jgi:TPP-dependent pyruvate/acetoin dehydrogenase alpha subunit
LVTKNASRAKREKKEVVAKPLKADHAQSANGNGAPASNREALHRLYVSMLRWRMLSEQARCLVAAAAPAAEFAIGHEAIVAGAALELEPNDTMVASPHNFAARIVTGNQLSAAVGKNGNRVGTAIAGAGGMAALDPLNLGTGIALAHQLEKTRNVVVALSAGGTSPKDRWHAAMKFAGAHKLPVIYVLRCSSAFENGATTRTPALEEISFMTHDCGFPAVIVDGNDAVAVWRVTQESIQRARNGAGPTLIECETRFTEYKDPLAHMEHYMRKRSVWDDRWRREAADEIRAEIKAMSAGGSASKGKAVPQPVRLS